MGYFESPGANAAVLRLEHQARARDLDAASKAPEDLGRELTRLGQSLQTLMQT